MFRSYTYAPYKGGANHFVVVDDDFTEIMITEEFVFDVVVRLYKKKGLPVASNLFRAMLYCMNINQSVHYDGIRNAIRGWRRSNPLIREYERELDRYLLLL